MNYKTLLLLLIISVAGWAIFLNKPVQVNPLPNLNDTSEAWQNGSQSATDFNYSDNSASRLPPLNSSQQFNYTRFIQPIDGDGECSNGEKCTSPDCPCQEGLTCSENAVCTARSTCGDNVCSAGETCCTDCGCSAGKFCQEITQTCLSALPALPTATISALLANYSASTSTSDSVTEELTYIGQFPDEVNGRPVTVVVADCGGACKKYLIVNAAGQVQGELQ